MDHRLSTSSWTQPEPASVTLGLACAGTTAAAGKLLFSGSRLLRESNRRQLSRRVETGQHISHWGCLAAGCRACGGNQTRNLNWSACWWAWPCAQASSACETRLKARCPRAPGKRSGFFTLPSLKTGWRPRAFGDRVCSSEARVPAFFPACLGFVHCCLPMKSGSQHSALSLHLYCPFFGVPPTSC